MKLKTLKRLLSLALVLALVLSVMPSILIWEANAVYEEAETVTETKSDRTTIYISSSGSEWYSGTSENRPKKDITKIPTYLAKGYNVKLKRGDIWYLPTSVFSLKDLVGTEENPLVLGSYGDGSQPMPTVAFLQKVENSAWTVVDAANNIYKTSVSFLKARGDTDIRVHRLFSDDAAFFCRQIKDYTQLEPEEFCDYGGTLYVRTKGGAPRNVEFTPFYEVGHRLVIKNVSYLTIENIHFKGSSVANSMIYLDAPTDHMKFSNCDITHCYYYIMMWEAAGANIHNQPEITGCFIDANLSEKEGFVNNGDGGNGSHWNVSAIEGITLRDGVDGAWIHNNHIRNMSHAFIAIESLHRMEDADLTGVRNCIIEDNLLEGGNAQYARAFNICGGYSISGVQMCRDNTFRRNQCYDMATASHLMGENNLVYSNIMSYHHTVYNEDGTIFDGKSPIPGAFDTIPWDNHVSIGNMLINNTFYDCASAITVSDPDGVVHDNIYANNLIVNWCKDVPWYPGAFYDNTPRMNYVMNNAVYSAAGLQDHFVVNNQPYLAEAVNELPGYSGNVSGNPMFLTADVNLTGKYTRQDFTLSSESPFRYAGLPLDDEVYAQFPAWQRLLAEYSDVNGNPFLPDAPAIGAIAYDADPPEKISITGVQTVLKPIGVVINYPDYAGEKWQEALGGGNVTVETSDGGTATVAVVWDFTPLGDMSKLGTYVIKGKLVSEFYENPRDLTLERSVVIQPKINLFANGDFEAVSGGQPTGWYMRGAGGITRGYSDLYPLSGKYAAWVRSTDPTATSREGYNRDADDAPAAVAARVNAYGAGQYYFGISVRRGDSTVPYSVTNKLTYQYDTLESGSGTPTGYANTINDVTEVYQTSAGVVDLPAGLTSVQMYFVLRKTDTTTSWDSIGAYADNAELIPLKIELADEMVSVETELPALSIVADYDSYVTDWQAGLNLPTGVTIKGNDGNLATAEVTWDYTPLGDLSKPGKYVLSGRLHSAVYANLKGLTVQQTILILPASNLLEGGDFENGNGGFNQYRWNMSSVKDPLNADDKVAFVTRDPLNSTGGTLGVPTGNSSVAIAPANKDPNGQLQLLAKMTAGQYAMQIKVMAAAYDKNSTAREDLSVNFVLRCYKEDGTRDDKTYTGSYKMSTSEWTTYTYVTEVDPSLYAKGVRPDVFVVSPQNQGGKAGAFYADDFELILLKTTLPLPSECVHNYRATVTEPTCLDAGSIMYECSNCCDSYTEEIPALGHTPAEAVKENETAGSCNIAGSYESVVYCSVCSVELSRKTIIGTIAHKVVDGVCTVCGNYGTCGENLTWSLDDSGTLTISGTGAMTDFASKVSTPWSGLLGEILSVVIKEGVTSIGAYAFNSCANLTEVTIPASVDAIGAYAFEYSTLLSSVYISDLRAWCEASFGNNSSTPLFYADNLYVNNVLVTDLVIPDGTTHISGYAFYDYDGFTSLTVAESVTSIGAYAFYGCTKLTEVTIPGGVTTIGEYAFSYSKVTRILLPETLQTVGKNAFNGCTSLSDVFYRGSDTDWAEIEIGKSNTKLTGAATLRNYPLSVMFGACTHSWQAVTCTTPKTCTICSATMGSAKGHSYNAVVTAPTCVAAGYTTYTCSACGDTYTTDETAATGEHNYVDGVCDVCGDVEVTGPIADSALKFMQSPSLSFQDYIGMQVLMTKKLANNYDTVYVEAVQVTPEGEVTTILNPITYMTNYYVFDQQIMAWSMTETVTLTLYAEKDGKTYVGQTYTQSVESLALAMMQKYSTNTTICRMLVDMLNYGAAVQTQFSHNAENLPNTQLGDFAAMGSTNIPECDAANTKTGTATVKVINDSVSMQAKVEIQLVIKGAVTATPKATIGTTVLNPVLDTTSIKGYTVIRVAVGATQLRETVTIALYDENDAPVTQVYNVSVEGYAVTAITGSQKNVVIAMMRYGDSVTAYANK